MSDSVHINGRELPASVVAAIRDGRWIMPDDEELIVDVFGERGPGPGRHLYSLDSMRRENPPENPWEPARAFPVLHGATGAKGRPGEADADQLVVIGDLGVDAPIALDYRISPPRVIYLGTSSSGWTTVGDDIKALMARLGLGRVERGMQGGRDA